MRQGIYSNDLRTYLETILVPSLSAGDVVVMRQSPGPQGRGWAKADRNRQRHADLSSTYSCDFNPIEMTFAKLKALLRKAAARTRDALWDSIDAAQTAFTPQDRANYVRHAGYAPL